MRLGEIIQAYRREHGISQRQFAASCEISNGYISMLEKGKNPRTEEAIIPSLAMLKKIADAMGTSLNELVLHAEDMKIYLSEEENASSHEALLLWAYRAQPELQEAVDRLLGLRGGEFVQLYAAAHSTEPAVDRLVSMEKDRWDALKSAPETDDPLL